MITEVGIVVPACNEQDLILDCVDAIDVSRTYLAERRPWIRTRLVVVLDACTDGTSDLLARRDDLEVVEVRASSVGAARAAGTEHVLSSSDAGLTWLANTDADSIVPPAWLFAMIEYAERGIDLVVGTVVPDDDLDVDRRRRWDARHHLVEGHPHVHGANLGFHADAYTAVGGWPGLRSGEDVALVWAIATDGRFKIVRTAGHPVSTSSRSVGRASDGFAGYLTTLGDLTLGGAEDLATPA